MVAPGGTDLRVEHVWLDGPHSLYDVSLPDNLSFLYLLLLLLRNTINTSLLRTIISIIKFQEPLH